MKRSREGVFGIMQIIPKFKAYANTNTNIKAMDLCFFLYILSVPFVYSRVASILPIQPLKLEILLLGISVLLLFMGRKKNMTGKDFWLFTVTLLILYTIGWIRSFDYALKILTINLVSELPITTYLINYTSWTIMAFAPLILIVWFFSNSEGVESIIKLFAVSNLLIAGFLILVFVFKTGDKSNFEVIRAELSSWMGMHGNDISNYFVLAFPLVLAWAVSKKSIISIAALVGISIGTLLCFSRTAYFLILFGFFLYLILSRRFIWVPVFAAAIVALVLLFVPGMVAERAVMGLESGDINEISAGRVDIWEPLYNELTHDSEKLLIGSGRYGITNTKAWTETRVDTVYHAHNMYLDCALDMGVIGLSIVLFLFLFVIFLFLRTSLKLKKTMPYYSDILIGCVVSIVCYLISGVTGRTFFPVQGNFFLWIIIGIGFAVMGSVRKEELI